MPIYHPEPGDDAAPSVRRQSYQSLACELLHCSPVTLYCSRSRLEEDLRALAEERFEVVRFECGKWEAVADAHAELAEKLAFPDYYGGNLAALDDCLRNLVEIDDEGGMAVVLDRFDAFHARVPAFARGMLDAFVRSNRLLQLFGKTMLVLVQSDDPYVDFGPLGEATAWWNRREFVDAERKLDDASGAGA